MNTKPNRFVAFCNIILLDSSLVFKEDTKDLSILMTSKLILLSYERLENPLPKSSIAILLPCFLISLIEF